MRKSKELFEMGHVNLEQFPEQLSVISSISLLTMHSVVYIFQCTIQKHHREKRI